MPSAFIRYTITKLTVQLGRAKEQAAALKHHPLATNFTQIDPPFSQSTQL